MSENQDIDWKGFKRTSLELREVSNPNLNLYNDYKTDLIKYINNSKSSVFNESKIKKYYFRKSVYFWSNSQIFPMPFQSQQWICEDLRKYLERTLGFDSESVGTCLLMRLAALRNHLMNLNQTRHLKPKESNVSVANYIFLKLLLSNSWLHW